MTAEGPPHPPEDGGEAAEHPLELALRHGLRYSGLRDVEIDPRLLLYVPLEICEHEAVLPLAVTDDVLSVATPVPDPDLELVSARFPALELELVLAPMDRIVELQEDLRAVL